MVKDAIEKYPVPITIGTLFTVASILVVLTWKVTVYTNNLEMQVRITAEQCQKLSGQVEEVYQLKGQIEDNTSSIDSLSSETRKLNRKLGVFLGKFENSDVEALLLTGG